MGERKVLVNYISPDFDPSIIPKMKRDRDRPQEIRMMLPFSMQCNRCGEFMYKGKKFNSKKEDCKGEDYMGIRRFRFYIKCTMCSNEISFKTDPKNTDYECESGANRTFEVWKEAAQQTEEVAADREEEDDDNMKALENRTLDSKIEMDVLDALDEIKAINQRHQRVDTSAVLKALELRAAGAGVGVAVGVGGATGTGDAAGASGLSAEDEALVKSIKFRSGNSGYSGNSGDHGGFGSSSSSGAGASVEQGTSVGVDGDGDAGGGAGMGGGAGAGMGGGAGVASLVQRQLSNINSASAPAPVVVIRKRKIDAAVAGKAVKDAKIVKLTVLTAAPVALGMGSMFADYGDSD